MPELSFMVVLVDTAFSRFWMCDTPNHWDFAWPTLLFLNRFWHMTPFSESSWWAVLFESSFIKIGQEINKLDFFAIYVSKIHKSQNSQKLVGDRAKIFAPWFFSNFFPYKFICQNSRSHYRPALFYRQVWKDEACFCMYYDRSACSILRQYSWSRGRVS